MAYPTNLDDWYPNRAVIRKGKTRIIPLTRAEKEARYDEALAALKADYYEEIKTLRRQYRELKQRYEDLQDEIARGLADQSEVAGLKRERDAILAQAKALRDAGEPTEVPAPAPPEEEGSPLP